MHFWLTQPSLRKDRACPRYRVAPLARQSLTRFENIKSLSSCFKRGRRIARIGTQREANALCVSSAKCRLFEISYVSLDDCFAALQIVYPPCGGWRISRLSLPLGVFASPWVANPRKGRLWLKTESCLAGEAQTRTTRPPAATRLLSPSPLPQHPAQSSSAILFCFSSSRFFLNPVNPVQKLRAEQGCDRLQ